MLHPYAIRCRLVALLLLHSTTLVQTKTIDISFADERVIIMPPTGWGYWTYNHTCPGVWTGYPDGTHTISLSFTGVGITVHGYADPRVAPWRFQINDEAPEALAVEPRITCKDIKDHQGLENGTHRVTVTPLAASFVLTKFSVTQLDEDNSKLSGSPHAGPCSLLFLFPLLVIVSLSSIMSLVSD